MKKNYILVRYEDLYENSKSQFTKIADFIGGLLKVKFAEAQIENAINLSSFERLENMFPLSLGHSGGDRYRQKLSNHSAGKLCTITRSQTQSRRWTRTGRLLSVCSSARKAWTWSYLASITSLPTCDAGPACSALTTPAWIRADSLADASTAPSTVSVRMHLCDDGASPMTAAWSGLARKRVLAWPSWRRALTRRQRMGGATGRAA